MTTLDERLDMETGNYTLSDDGQALRDRIWSEALKTRKTPANLCNVIFVPQGFAKQTVTRILRNQSVKVGSLIRFFEILVKELNLGIEFKFDENKHSKKDTTSRKKPLLGLIPHSIEKVTASYLLIKVWKAKATDFGYCIEAAIASSKTPLGEDTWLTESKVSLNWDNELVENFPKRLDDLLNEVSRDIPIDKLTVQWFLPIELMSLPIEHWEIA